MRWHLYLFGLCLAFVMAACSKDDPEPDAATQVAGEYPISYYRADSADVTLYEFNLPYTAGTTTLSGLITARRDSANVLFLTQTIKITGETDQTSALGQVKLQAVGSGYDMYYGTQKVGSIDGTNISIDDQAVDTSTGTTYRTIINGRK